MTGSTKIGSPVSEEFHLTKILCQSCVIAPYIVVCFFCPSACQFDSKMFVYIFLCVLELLIVNHVRRVNFLTGIYFIVSRSPFAVFWKRIPAWAAWHPLFYRCSLMPIGEYWKYQKTSTIRRTDTKPQNCITERKERTRASLLYLRE